MTYRRANRRLRPQPQGVRDGVRTDAGMEHSPEQVAIRTIDDHAIHAVLVGRIGVVPVQALWTTAIAVALWFLLNRHRFGEHLLFIGDNVSVARVVGVNVGREKIKLFTLMGVLGAFAAVLLTAENKNFFNTQGSGFLLTVMAAVFIGGTSIFGGKATIVGSYVGAYIIGMIEAGLVATGMQGFWVRAVVGLVFLAAVVFHLSMDQPQRLAWLKQRLGLQLPRSPGESEAGRALRRESGE